MDDKVSFSSISSFSSLRILFSIEFIFLNWIFLALYEVNAVLSVFIKALDSVSLQSPVTSVFSRIMFYHYI